MLGLTDVTEQLPNCLNTMCFLEASITGIISRCIECWDLDVPANRMPSHPLRTLVEEAVVFTHLKASSLTSPALLSLELASPESLS